MKKQIIKQAAALSLAVAVMAPAASALSWKDGAPANYRFTYAGDNGGIASVTASDKNGTYQGGVEVGQTITTKTGTIVWRDSYTNVTTFTVTTQPGYELVGLSGANVAEDDFQYGGGNTYTFSFTDRGAEAWCYGKDVDFALETEKIEYTFKFNVDDKEYKTTTNTVGDPLNLPEEPEKEGYTFTGWYVNGEKLTDSTLTEKLIKLAGEDKTLDLTAGFTVNTYNVRIHYYTDNRQGVCKTLDTHYNYGETPVVDQDAKLIGGGEVGPITGDTTLDLVKYSPVAEDDWSYEYGFRYSSKDAGVESVAYSIDDSAWTAIDVNEGVKFATSWAGKDYTRTIKFLVQVADGMKLELACSDDSNEVTDNEDGTYTFLFTRTAHQGWKDSNVPNVDFVLTTLEK